MPTPRSEKELAFLHDLYVSTDWGERFSKLFDDQLELLDKGQVLYVACGTGGHALALQEKSGEKVTLVCIDESEECLELARAKAMSMKAEAEFSRSQIDELEFGDDRFDLVVGDGSLVPVNKIRKVVSEMVRVAAPNATVALTFPTESSFGEFFSIYWEALKRAGLEEHSKLVEDLITELPSVTDFEAMATEEGLDAVASWTAIEEFQFESGEEFLNSPLISDFLLKRWLEPIPDEESRQRIAKEIEKLIDEDRHDLDFSLTVKATLVMGRKGTAM